tara:strand:+ start:2459 stop:2653 length:195 start_codon:yes stop_codon:yes gene_type:complete
MCSRSTANEEILQTRPKNTPFLSHNKCKGTSAICTPSTYTSNVMYTPPPWTTSYQTKGEKCGSK